MAMSEQLDADGGRCLLLLHAPCRELNAESKKPAGVKCQKKKKKKKKPPLVFHPVAIFLCWLAKKKKKKWFVVCFEIVFFFFFFVTLTKVEPNKLHL